MKVMVVGCGSIGRRHLDNLIALGVDDIIACDPNEDLRAPCVGKGISFYLDLHEAIVQNPDVTAAVICSPTHLHLEHASVLANCGVHLLIEKPLSHALAGIASLTALVEQNNLTAMMAMCYRFHPSLLAIKNLLEQGIVGRVYSVRIAGGHYLPDWHPQMDYRDEYTARASMGGGVLLTNVVHSLDSVRWLFGECTEVQFLVRTIGDLEIDTDDVAAGYLGLESGVLVHMYADFLQRNAQYRIEIIGQTGTIHWEFGDSAVLVYSDGDWQSFPAQCDPNQMYLDEMRAFIACIAHNTPSPVSLHEGLQDMLVLEAMRQSSDERRLISVPAYRASASTHAPDISSDLGDVCSVHSVFESVAT